MQKTIVTLILKTKHVVMNKKSVLALLFIVTTIFTQVVAQNDESKAWTLDDCIKHAQTHNISIKQQRLQAESSNLDVIQSKLDFLPDASANAGYNFGWGRTLNESSYTYTNEQTSRANFSVGAQVILFNGLQQYNTLKYRQILSKIGIENVAVAMDNISVAITRAYLSVLLSQDLLAVAEKQVKVTAEQVNRTKELVDAGSLAYGSLLEIQAQHATEEANVISSENSLSLAYLDLLQLLDMHADENFHISKPNLDNYKNLQISSSGAVYETAVENRPEIRSALLNVKGANKYLSISKGAHSPTLSMNGGISTWYSDPFAEFDPATQQFINGKSFGAQFADNKSPYLGFSLNIPIFSGFRTTTNVKKAQINKMDAELNLLNQKNNLRKTIEQSANDARAAKNSFGAAEKATTNYEESFRYTSEKFNVGLANAVDFTVAKNLLIKSQSDLLRAKYNYIFTLKILDFYKGESLSFK